MKPRGYRGRALREFRTRAALRNLEDERQYRRTLALCRLGGNVFHIVLGARIQYDRDGKAIVLRTL